MATRWLLVLGIRLHGDIQMIVTFYLSLLAKVSDGWILWVEPTVSLSLRFSLLLCWLNIFIRPIKQKPVKHFAPWHRLRCRLHRLQKLLQCLLQHLPWLPRIHLQLHQHKVQLLLQLHPQRSSEFLSKRSHAITCCSHRSAHHLFNEHFSFIFNGKG